ncbi:unnamed protein product, partial [marine sediment metagenome]
MSDRLIVIFFSKDRAMQLDAAIHSMRVHCKDLDLSGIKKVVIFKTTSEIHADQYAQLQCENQDFAFIEEQQVIQQILLIASPFKFISFHCDDNIYIRDFAFIKVTQILSEIKKDSLGHSFRLGKNITYSYTRNSLEPQPIFYNLDSETFVWNWIKMQPRGFGYPLELSASVYRCEHILPLILKLQNSTIANIESYLMTYRHKFSISHPFSTCDKLPSVISVPVNRVGVIQNKAGQKYSYSIE